MRVERDPVIYMNSWGANHRDFTLRDLDVLLVEVMADAADDWPPESDLPQSSLPVGEVRMTFPGEGKKESRSTTWRHSGPNKFSPDVCCQCSRTAVIGRYCHEHYWEGLTATGHQARSAA